MSLSDSDETLPPSDFEERCDSPDLFDDRPVTHSTKKTPSAMNQRINETRKDHALSESDSESEDLGVTSVSNQQKEVIKSTENFVNKDVSKRSAFIDEFLNMTDSDTEGESDLLNRESKSHKYLSQNSSSSESQRVKENQRKLEKLKKAKHSYDGDLNISSTSKKNGASHNGSDRSVEKTDPLSTDSSKHDPHHYSQKQHKKNYSKPYDSDKHGKGKDKAVSNKISIEHSSTASSSSKHSVLSKPYTAKSESPQSLKRKLSDSLLFAEQNKTSLVKNKTLSPKTTSEKSDSPSRILKRKHSDSSSTSQSKVQPELRKAVTEILQVNDAPGTVKVPCRYGSLCYRKNPSHFEEYSHPEDDSKQSTAPAAKKPKVDTERPLASKINERPSTSKPSERTSTPKVKERPLTPKIEDKPSTSKVKPVSPLTSKTPPQPRVKVPIKHITNPRSVREKFEQAQPYSFFLTRVAGIDEKYNSTFVMDIKDILSEEMGNLKASCQFNFMFDIQWLIKQYPPQFRSKPLMIVHGEKGPSMASLQAQAMSNDNIRFCQAKLDIMYGTHHTKMMLLLYEEGMRVVIHTSNLISQDWYQKTQGMWISPVFPRLAAPSKEAGDSPSRFKKDLIEYLAAYRAYQLKDWIDHIASHDMSSARVLILGSVPGRHVDRQKSQWGHMKLRRVLQEYGPSQTTVKTWPVIGQFSSIGSMGANKDAWLCGEWLQSLSATKTGKGPQSSARLQLVFPSKDNVRLSLEGFPAGGSIPYSVNTAKKQTYLQDFFHVWRSEGRGRSRAMPHIKSYLRPTQEGPKAAWFSVTSANLSKAAWGALEKKGAQLMIRSYEIGVLYLPKFFDAGEEFEVTSDPGEAARQGKFLLPYDLPTKIYEKKDRPWMWDIPYMDLPDTNGNMWCPFSK